MPSICSCTEHSTAQVPSSRLTSFQKSMLVALAILGTIAIAWGATALAHPKGCPTFLAKFFEAVPQGAQITILVAGILLLAIPLGLLIKDCCSQKEAAEVDATQQLREAKGHFELTPQLFIKFNNSTEVVVNEKIAYLECGVYGFLQEHEEFLKEAHKVKNFEAQYRDAIADGKIVVLYGFGREWALLFADLDEAQRNAALEKIVEFENRFFSGKEKVKHQGEPMKIVWAQKRLAQAKALLQDVGNRKTL